VQGLLAIRKGEASIVAGGGVSGDREREREGKSLHHAAVAGGGGGSKEQEGDHRSDHSSRMDAEVEELSDQLLGLRKERSLSLAELRPSIRNPRHS
jgi:hypothetical protein